MKKGRPLVKVKRPRQSAIRQYTGPLALLNFVGNETASFIRQISCCHSRLEKELNRQRQTLKLLENQGFFRLSLLYRNGTLTQLFFCCFFHLFALDFTNIVWCFNRFFLYLWFKLYSNIY